MPGRQVTVVASQVAGDRWQAERARPVAIIGVDHRPAEPLYPVLEPDDVRPGRGDVRGRGRDAARGGTLGSVGRHSQPRAFVSGATATARTNAWSHTGCRCWAPDAGLLVANLSQGYVEGTDWEYSEPNQPA